jgi:hypothetical protein
MATLREAFPSKFLKAGDLAGMQMPATVKLAAMETVQAPGEPPEQKVALHFLGALKPLILNATNFKAMISITGQEDSDNWAGAKILLVTEQAAFGGKVFDAIRIKPLPVKSQATKDLNAILADVDVTEENPF